MAEYIERECLLRKFNIDDMMNVNGTLISLSDARNVIEKQPAADVAPVVHGRWVDDEPDLTHGCYHHSAHYQCSVCGRRTGRNQTRNYKFCPKCGAKMDGEADGET